MVEIIVSIISAAATITAVVITTVATSRKSAANVNTKLEVLEVKVGNLDGKVGNLSDEVREHNAYGRLIPVLQERIDQLEHRLGKLEKGA